MPDLDWFSLSEATQNGWNRIQEWGQIRLGFWM